MAPGRKRGAKGAKAKSELSLGDLVLAKVKGFPAWPAKIARPEDWDRTTDPKKYFVQFFGTSEIAFVAPADIQAFTIEAKTKLLARCLGKTVKYFAQAVKEICEEFEELQRKKLSGVGDDTCTQTHPSEAPSVDLVVDEALDGNRNNEIRSECKLETKESAELSAGLEQDELKCQDMKPNLSDDMNRSLSPPLSLRKRNNLSDHKNDSDLLSVSCSSHHSCKKEYPQDINVKGKNSDGSRNELTNGHSPKLAIGSEKKSEGAVLRTGGLDTPRDHSLEVMRRKVVSGGIMKLSSPDIPKLSSNVSSQKRDKKLLKGKRHSEKADDGQEDAKINFEAHGRAITRKKVKVENTREKQVSQTKEASSPAKLSKTADTRKDTNLIKPQINCSSNSRSSNVDKMTKKEPKSLASVGTAEVFQPHRVSIINNSESDQYSDDDDLPPIKRHRRESEITTGSALISENKSRTFVPHRTDLVLPGKVRSPNMQSSTKRRSVRRCDDEDDELPKTPIHGRTISKVSVTPRTSVSKKKYVMQADSHVHDPLVLKNPGLVDYGLKEHVQSDRVMNKMLPSASQQSMDKRTRESLATHASPSPRLNFEKSAPVEVKPVSVSPKRSYKAVDNGRLSGEVENKQPNKAPIGDFGIKTQVGDEKNAAPSDTSNLFFQNQLVGERSKQSFSGERKKTTPKSDSRITVSASVVKTSDENIMSIRERPNIGKDNKASHAIDSKISESPRSMKNLIAAAQARKKQAHLHNTYGNPLLFSIPDIDIPGHGPSPLPGVLAFEANNTLQLDVLGSHSISPGSNFHQIPSNIQHENDELEERRVSSGHQATGSSLSGGTEAAVARDAFEGMIETLSRTKESIARATRLAIDCAKYGLANEVMELLIQKLENEPNLHRRVDLFFLVDSITQCSHSQREASYVSTVQAALPRLIGAAAPAGAGAQENRRQCHKVLRLWLERKILPETVLRRYMDGIGVVNNDTSISSRRPSRAERSFDDPIREMEGMVVDEYGSNAMFQLPGLLSVNVFEEEDQDEDASDLNLCMNVDDRTPSKNTPATGTDPENHAVTPSDRRHCILEEVDGELEMEDVSGHQKDERPLMSNGSVELASLDLNSDGILESSGNITTQCLPSPDGSPPLPPGSPPVTPPLPTSPPPSHPPPPPPSSPPPPPPPTTHHPFPQLIHSPQPPVGHVQHVGPTPPAGSSLRPCGPSFPLVPPPPHLRPTPPPLGPHPPPFGPPPPLGPHAPLLPQQSFPPQPPIVSQNMTPLPSTVPLSPRSSFQPPPLPQEVGATANGNQQSLMVPSTSGSHIDASIRGGVLPQQSSSFPPAGVSSGREHDAYRTLQALQYRQPHLPSGVPFSQRPLHPELQSQCPPSHFPYPNSSQQHQYQSYPLPNISDGSRRYIADEQWRIQGNEINVDHTHGGWMPGRISCSGVPYSQEGYHERPPAGAINFQHSAPNTLPSGHIPVHGVPVMASRPNMSAVNWRPP